MFELFGRSIRRGDGHHELHGLCIWACFRGTGVTLRFVLYGNTVPEEISSSKRAHPVSLLTPQARHRTEPEGQLCCRYSATPQGDCLYGALCLTLYGQESNAPCADRLLRVRSVFINLARGKKS